jgi:Predicted nucleic acid-binding protein, contains PIN domain
MRYLLDTNIVSDLVRNPQGRIASKIRVVGEKNICTSVIVSAELRYGAERKQSHRLTAQLETVLNALTIVPLESPSDNVYGHLRCQLEKAGTTIGGNDLLIAAQAIALGLVVVTDNEREFSRIVELPVENWLR